MNTIIKSPSLGLNERSLSQGLLDEELEFLWPVRDRAGRAYDLYLERISRNPVVRSHATGKYTMLPWSQIIELEAEDGTVQK